MDIKKAIIPAAGLGTRFLPLTLAGPKELLPLGLEPMISYAVKETRDSEISEIIFVVSENKKNIFEYFKENPKLKSILKKREQKSSLQVLKKREGELSGLSFSLVSQPVPKGDGEAILRARTKIKKEPFAVLFPDDIIESKVPALKQLKKIFSTSQKPVLGLQKVPQEKLSSYGVVEVQKIANRLSKIKEIIEKPRTEEAPSDLAIVGRYILTPEIFNYLAKTPLNKKGELILAETLKLMLKDGKIIYGYEIEGKWLECGNKIDWLKSNLYLCLKHPEYGPILKEFLKKMK
ncbi:MAG: UTP--glucose-1-phosphate uridylyltransferase [Patescibacteria group bacterium]|nr:UTP--glucose-1-phosphate uridylyltransferase [Patescibacteria group bacterium]